MSKQSIIHLLSGGLDSVTMLYDLQQQGGIIHCVLVDYKQPHVQELEFAKIHCQRLSVPWTRIDLPDLGGLKPPDWVVPNRNAILISLAVNVAIVNEAQSVTIGCNADDAERFPDCRKPFLDSMNQAVKDAGYNVTVLAPYLTWSKWRIGGLARELGISSDEIWSCYRGGKEPCGKCPACEKLASAIDPLARGDALAKAFPSKSTQLPISHP